MPVLQQNKLFGTLLRTRVLVAIAALEETFPSELARVLESKLFPIQRVLDALEAESVVVSRKPGVERRVTLNPGFFANNELRNLLLVLAEQDRNLTKTLASR